MPEHERQDPEAHAQGWRTSIQEAANAALSAAGPSAGEALEVEVIYGRRLNPIHEYKVVFKASS